MRRLLLASALLAAPAVAQPLWVSGPPLREPRQEVAVAELDGRVYVVGGLGAAGQGVATVEALDTRSGTWTFTAPLPQPLHHTTAVALGGRLYVAGGYGGGGFSPVASAYVYTPSEDRWSAIASLPSPRGALVAAAVGGKLYAIGGAAASALATVSVYDPSTDRWSAASPMPTSREHHAAAVLDGRIYVAGGRRPGTLTLRTLEEYDPATDRWRARAPMPTGRSGIAGAAFGGRFYVLGGEGNGARLDGVFPEVESYDPSADRWRAEPPMPTPRHGIGAAVVRGGLSVPGGGPVQGFGVTAVHELLRLAVVPLDASERPRRR